jgi:DNA polymerase-3 subunit alpha (Gram-positive type)
MNKGKLKSIMCSAATGMITLSTAAETENSQDKHSDASPVSDVSFVVFDTETTGWNKENGRVIEIGAIKFKNGIVLAKKSWLINPGIPITSSSQRIHGISDSMVKDSPSFREVYAKFAAFTKGSVLLAHNASYDVRFVTAEIERNKLTPIPNQTIDTLRLARKWFPELKSHSLTNLIRDLSIPSGTMHRALADSECTKDMFLLGLKKMKRNATFSDLKDLAGKVYLFE